MWDFEARAWEAGHTWVAGVDEVGRGPLAGPVVAAAVVWPPRGEPGHEAARRALTGLTDSKQLSPERRAYFVPLIQEHARGWAVAEVDVATIDAINILRASQEAMIRALHALEAVPEWLLVDGHLKLRDWSGPQEALIKGDGRSISIAGASVLAKEYRDALMRELDARYPQYGFAQHKGYPTPAHRRALAVHGLCPEHRRSFAPCRQLSLF